MSAPTVALAAAALRPESIALMEENRLTMVEQRDRFLHELSEIPGFGGLMGGLETNYVLIRFLSKPADQGGVPDNGVTAAILHTLAATPKFYCAIVVMRLAVWAL